LGKRQVELLPKHIDGHCFVQCLDNENQIHQWVKEDNHWYIKGWPLESSFTICKKCLDQHMEEMNAWKMFLENGKKLQCLELFSGLF
jgi:hypothetical protein